MNHPHPYQPNYTRAERLSDAIVHLMALGAAIAAVPVMITFAAIWEADFAALTGVAIYGCTLIAMILCSFLYNHFPHPDWSRLLRRMDHIAIYLKIAGTYTPFALLSGTGMPMLATIWGGAIAATSYTLIKRRRSVMVGALICLAMGWAVLIGGRDLLAELSTPVLILMLVGGVIYSAGVPFLMACKMRYHNTIWHLFVMSASVLYFVAVFIHLAQVA